MKTTEYDFVAIGGGPAGHRAAIQAAKSGAKTALIDRRASVGGVSLHAGTVPSKTLREAVMFLCGTRQKIFYGDNYQQNQNISLKDLLARVQTVVQKETEVMDFQLKRNGVDVIHGQASFEDSHTLVVTDIDGNVLEKIIADKILIGVGTVPRRPEEIPFDQEVIFDSNFIFSTKNKREQLPSSLCVIGAGVIGTEYACMFAALGCDVWLVDRRRELFRFLDHDIHDQMLLSLSRAGVQIRLEDEVGEISRTPEGRGRVELGESPAIEADAVLFAMGRTPCTFTLNIQNTNIQLGKYDVIDVNDNYQTAEPHIYACGDVIGFPALASTSAEQARIATRHALGLDCHVNKETFPFAIYSIPEISMVGKTEQELIDEGVPYCAGNAFYREIPKAAIIGDTEGALKILFHKETRKILGVHMIGDLASELLHLGAIAMNSDATIDVFTQNVFNFPTLAEAYRIAAWNGIHNLEGTSYDHSLIAENAF